MAEMLCSFFRLELGLIMRLTAEGASPDSGTPEELRVKDYKKCLIYTLLDGLAALAVEDARGNRDRFTKLILRYASWPQAELISAPILGQRLADRKSDSPLYHRLRDHIWSRDLHAGGTLNLEYFDLPVDDLQLDEASDEEASLAGCTRHVDLFYEFRNFLVHEFRTPGAMDALTGDDAGYQNTGDHWPNLVHPLRFYERIAAEVIDGLEAYFKENGIDPYERLGGTATWSHRR